MSQIEYHDDGRVHVKCVGPCKTTFIAGYGLPGDPFLSTTYNDFPIPHWVCPECNPENLKPGDHVKILSDFHHKNGIPGFAPGTVVEVGCHDTRMEYPLEVSNNKVYVWFAYNEVVKV